jgi:hypothetical protein
MSGLVRGAVLATTLLVVLGACGAVTTPPALTIPPQPIVDCLAVPAERCSAALAQAQVDAPRGSAPLRIRMTCSQPACTVVGGAAQVDAWFSDGSVSSWDTAWSGALEVAPAPAPEEAILPVTPA